MELRHLGGFGRFWRLIAVRWMGQGTDGLYQSALAAFLLANAFCSLVKALPADDPMKNFNNLVNYASIICLQQQKHIQSES